MIDAMDCYSRGEMGLGRVAVGGPRLSRTRRAAACKKTRPNVIPRRTASAPPLSSAEARAAVRSASVEYGAKASAHMDCMLAFLPNLSALDATFLLAGVPAGGSLREMARGSGTAEGAGFEVALSGYLNADCLDLRGMFRGSGARSATLENVGNGGADPRDLSKITDQAQTRRGYGDDVIPSGYTDMSYMFFECPNLYEVGLFNVGNGYAACFDYMFANSNELERATLDNVGNGHGSLYRSKEGYTSNAAAIGKVTSFFCMFGTNVASSQKSKLWDVSFTNVGNGYGALAYCVIYKNRVDAYDGKCSSPAHAPNIRVTDSLNGYSPWVQNFMSFYGDPDAGGTATFTNMCNGTNPFLMFAYEGLRLDYMYFYNCIAFSDGGIRHPYGFTNASLEYDWCSGRGLFSRGSYKEFYFSGSSSSGAVDMSVWFYECRLLKKVTFDYTGPEGGATFTPNALNGTFWGCSSLEEIDLTGIDTSRIISDAPWKDFWVNTDLSLPGVNGIDNAGGEGRMLHLFHQCASLKTVRIGSAFKKICNGFFGTVRPGYETDAAFSYYGTGFTTNEDSSVTWNYFDLYVYGGPMSVGSDPSVDVNYLWKWPSNKIETETSDTTYYPGKIYYMSTAAVNAAPTVWAAETHKYVTPGTDLSENDFFAKELGTVVDGQQGDIGWDGSAIDGSVKWDIRVLDGNYRLAIWPSDLTSGVMAPLGTTPGSVAPPWLSAKDIGRVIEVRVIEGTYVGGNLDGMFEGMSSLRSADLTYLRENEEGLANAGRVCSMKNMFKGCSSLTSVLLRNICNAPGLVMSTSIENNNAAGMFSGCTSLESLTLMNFGNGLGSKFNSMFRSLGNIKRLTLSNFGNGGLDTRDLSKITDQAQTRRGYGDDIIPLGYTDMSYMFFECSQLYEISLSNVGNGYAANFGCMFANCNELQHVSLSNVGNGHGSLYREEDGYASGGDAVGKATSFSYMFGNNTPNSVTSKLWDVSIDNVGNGFGAYAVGFIFKHRENSYDKKCSSPAHTPDIKVSNSLNGYAPWVQNFIGFYGDPNVGGTATFTNIFNGTNPYLLFSFEGLRLDYMNFYDCMRFEDVGIDFSFGGGDYICESASGRGLFSRTSCREFYFAGSSSKGDMNMSSWFFGCELLEKVVFDYTGPSGGAMFKPNSLVDMFRNCESLTTIDLTGIDTSLMSADDPEIWNSTVTGGDVNVDDGRAGPGRMIWMFQGCSSLQQITIGSAFKKICNGFFGTVRKDHEDDLKLSSYGTGYTENSDGSLSWNYPDVYVYGGPLAPGEDPATDSSYLWSWPSNKIDKTTNTDIYPGHIFLMDDAARASEETVWKAKSYKDTVAADFTVNFIIDDVIYATQPLKEGTESDPALATYVNPASLKEGYTCEGWWTNPSFIGSKYEFSTPVTGDLSLYARSTPNQYTIKFAAGLDAKGQSLDSKVSGLPEDYAATYDASWTVTEAIPERTGYTFVGWSTDRENPTVATYNAGSTYTRYTTVSCNVIVPTNPSGDMVTLYAAWIPNNDVAYTVNVFVMNSEGAYDSSPSFTRPRTDGTSDHPMDGLDAWYLSYVLSNADTSNCSYAFDSGNPGNDYTKDVSPEGNTVFTLYYKRQHTVTIEPGNHGSFPEGTKTEFVVDYIEDLEVALGDEELPVPTNTDDTGGYERYAWGSDVGATYYVVHGTKVEADRRSDRTSNDVIPVHQNVTLTALWSGKEYRVQFDSGEYNVADSEGIISEGVLMGRTVSGVYWDQSDPTSWKTPPVSDLASRKGYVVSGWKSCSDFKLTAADTINPDTEWTAKNLTSKWESTVTYSATYEAKDLPLTFSTVGGSATYDAADIEAQANSIKAATGAKAVSVSGNTYTLTYKYRDADDTTEVGIAERDSNQKLPDAAMLFTRHGYDPANWRQAGVDGDNRDAGLLLKLVGTSADAKDGYSDLWDNPARRSFTACWENVAFDVSYAVGTAASPSLSNGLNVDAIKGATGATSASIDGTTITATYTYFDTEADSGFDSNAYRQQSILAPNATYVSATQFPEGEWTSSLGGTQGAGAMTLGDTGTLKRLYNGGEKVTLTATWTNNYVITLNLTANDTEGHALVGTPYKAGDASKLEYAPASVSFSKWAETVPALDVPALDGYEFIGWKYTDHNGAEKGIGTNGIISKDDIDPLTFGDEEMYPDGLIITAQWRPNTYKVSFDKNEAGAPKNGGNDGEMTMADMNVIYGDSEGAKAPECTYVAQGYKFIGWVKDLDAGVNENTLIVPGASIDRLSFGSTQGETSTAVTLHAVWQERTYRLSFDLTDVDNELAKAVAGVPKTMSEEDFDSVFSDQTVTYLGTTATLPTINPSKIGKDFVQWQTGGDSPVAFTAEITPKALGANDANDVEHEGAIAIIPSFGNATIEVRLHGNTTGVETEKMAAIPDASGAGVTISNETDPLATKEFTFDDGVGAGAAAGEPGSVALPIVGYAKDEDASEGNGGVFQRRGYTASSLWYSTSEEGFDNKDERDDRNDSMTSDADVTVATSYDPNRGLSHNDYVSLYRQFTLPTLKGEASASDAALYARWNPSIGVTAPMTLAINFYVESGETDYVPMPIVTSTPERVQLSASVETPADSPLRNVFPASGDAWPDVYLEYCVRSYDRDEFGNLEGVSYGNVANIPVFTGVEIPVGDAFAYNPDKAPDGTVEIEGDGGETSPVSYQVILDGGMRLSFDKSSIGWNKEWLRGQIPDDTKHKDFGDVAKLHWTVELAG